MFFMVDMCITSIVVVSSYVSARRLNKENLTINLWDQIQMSEVTYLHSKATCLVRDVNDKNENIHHNTNKKESFYIIH